MKNVIKRKVSLTILLFMVIALCAGLFLINKTKTEAFADTSTDFNFRLINNNTEYSVTVANKSLTQAEIPESYNGLPVTEIADNGFLSCTYLEEIIIPKTVKKVGNNAFSNCRKLQKLRGMSNVEKIGNNAFAMCSSLTNLIIPSTVKSVGSTILRNVVNPVYVRCDEAYINGLNAGWKNSCTAEIIYGNALTYSPMEVSTYAAEPVVVGYIIDDYQNLNCPDDDVIVKCSYEKGGQYYPVINIADSAFSFSTVKSLTIQYDTDNVGNNYTVNLSSNAFYCLFADSLDIQVKITLYDKNNTDGAGKAINVFSGSTFNSITLPEELETITSGMFDSCENLSEIYSYDRRVGVNHLSSNITAIDSGAFTSCTALKELYIPESVTYIGDYAFENMGKTSQKIYFDRYTPNGFSQNWDKNVGAKIDFNFKPITVSLEHNGGESETSYITIQYGKSLPVANLPTRNGYNFKGYYTEQNGNGTCYYNENMKGKVVWTGSEPIILYAYWKPYQFNITLDRCYGAGGTQLVVAEYEQPMPSAEAPVRYGYDFGGYFDSSLGMGFQYYDANMQSVRDWTYMADTTLYAHWIPKQTTVIFDKKGGEGGSYFVTATFDNSLPYATAPTRPGYTFLGYYTEAGVQYYDENMNASVFMWDIAEENIVLYAHWRSIDCRVMLDNQDGNADRLSVLVKYGEEMPAAPIPEKHGYIFNGYYFELDGKGKKYYNSDMTSANNWDIEDDATLYAYWTAIEYNITYVGVSAENNPNPLTYTIEDEFTFANPTDCGYVYNCDWVPLGITRGTMGDQIVTARYFDRKLYENSEVIDGVKYYYIYSNSQFLDINDIKIEAGITTQFVLKTDLDFYGYTNPMISTRFEAVFDGQNHIIRGVNLTYTGNAETNYLGLFSYNFHYSVIKNLTVYGKMDIKTNSYSGYVGLLCGLNQGTITDCKVYGDSRFEQQYDIVCDNHYMYVGGIAGGNTSNGLITNCTNNATICAFASIGGIVGSYESNSNEFIGNVNNGNIYFNGNEHSCYVGSLIGRMDNGNMSGCTNSGNIYILVENGSTIDTKIGKLIGRAVEASQIGDTQNSGHVYSGNSTDGFVAYAAEDIGTLG